MHLRDLFASDPARGTRLTADAAGLYLDYSKNRITDETLRLLVALAEQAGVAERRDAMFAGEHINVTEDRAVLHVALRMPREPLARRRRRGRRRRGARGARPDGGVLASASAPASGGATPGKPIRERRQHRDRRLRPRPRDGLRRAPALQPARHDLPLRLERRRHRFRRGDARSRSGARRCSSSPRRRSRRSRR